MASLHSFHAGHRAIDDSPKSWRRHSLRAAAPAAMPLAAAAGGASLLLLLPLLYSLRKARCSTNLLKHAACDPFLSGERRSPGIVELPLTNEIKAGQGSKDQATVTTGLFTDDDNEEHGARGEREVDAWRCMGWGGGGLGCRKWRRTPQSLSPIATTRSSICSERNFVRQCRQCCSD